MAGTGLEKNVTQTSFRMTIMRRHKTTKMTTVMNKTSRLKESKQETSILKSWRKVSRLRKEPKKSSKTLVTRRQLR